MGRSEMSLRRIVCGLMLTAWLISGSEASRAQNWMFNPTAPSGNSVAVGRATLLLPPGDWAQVSEIVDDPLQMGGQSLYIETKWLAQVTSGQLAATLSVRSNLTRSNRGWRRDKQCLRHDTIYFSNQSESDSNFDCMLVANRLFYFGDNPTEYWVKTFDKLTALGKVPHLMVCAMFSMASRSRLDFISVQACFNPALAGFADNPTQNLATTDWNKRRISPDRRAYVDRIIAWAQSYHNRVADAF